MSSAFIMCLNITDLLCKPYFEYKAMNFMFLYSSTFLPHTQFNGVLCRFILTPPIKTHEITSIFILIENPKNSDQEQS